jgi:DNA invertase Pin-like site-specific DNA recombinase
MDKEKEKEKPKHIVGYRRTSTDDQLLGIEAQDAAITRIAAEKSCKIARVFTEHESGGDNARPELARALTYARRTGATLVVAKLDRLARDSSFLMSIYDGKVPVIFGDLPEVDGSAASRFMIQTMANVAEFERRRIGERIKEALGVLKARGVKLGTPRNLRDADRLKGSRKAAQLSTARAVAEMADVAPVAAKMRKEGASLAQIAAVLDTEGYLTRRGKTWTPTQVKRVLDRSASQSKEVHP